MKNTAYKIYPQNLIQMCLQALQSIYCLISVGKILNKSVKLQATALHLIPYPIYNQ